jgi:hypothetical protein
MGHNLSRESQRRLERQQRAEALAKLLVPGWTLNIEATKFVEVPTLLGSWQRGQRILLRCAKRDCRRRVELDLRAAIDAGLGDRQVADILGVLTCRHWTGCALKFEHATYPKGVPLISTIEHRDVLIAVACDGCAARLLLPPIRVIERLIETGRGNAATGLLELGQKVRGPCRKCGGRRFTSALIWPDARGTKAAINKI